ncbi:MAG: phosphotransferase family protein [Tepidiformaceae bacterium]
MPAGASNDTASLDIRMACDGHEFTLATVLRMERADGILAPYDVAREHRVMRALQGAGIRVATPLWLEESGEVLGRRFFVMERVRGETLPLYWYGGRSRRLEACAETLARIHEVKAGAVAAAFGTETEYEAWQRKAAAAGIEAYPLLIRLGGWLERNEPLDARMAVLHGDPNPGNYLFDGDRVAAVLDWELAAIGDPRSDLGFYAALLAIFGGAGMRGGRTLLSEAYADVTGTQLSSLEYYAAFGLYRMAVIAAGWGRRMGDTSGYFLMEPIERELAALLGPRWAA